MQPSSSWLLPCPRAGGAGVSWVNPCAASCAVSWALTSSSSAFGVVVLTQIIWDLSWQPKFTRTAAPGPTALICVSLCTPQACHCILGNVSCLTLRGSDWNCAKPSKERGKKIKITCFFGWERKLWGSHRYCQHLQPRALYQHSPSAAVTEPWSRDLTLFMEVLQVFSQPLLELCSPCTNNDWLVGVWAQTLVSQIPGHL